MVKIDVNFSGKFSGAKGLLYLGCPQNLWITLCVILFIFVNLMNFK